MAPEERFRAAMEHMQKHKNPDKPGVSKAQTSPDGTPDTSVSRTDSSSAPQTNDGSRPRVASPAEKKLSVPLVQVPLPTNDATANTDIPIAMHVFQSTLSKMWNPKKMEPPKGTFVVQGLVEVRGARGKMLFDVQSAYDPKAGKYVQVNAGVRGYKKWNQAPRGGP
jgi:hypothetical protein